jgi:hypothetical protein
MYEFRNQQAIFDLPGAGSGIAVATDQRPIYRSVFTIGSPVMHRRVGAAVADGPKSVLSRLGGGRIGA